MLRNFLVSASLVSFFVSILSATLNCISDLANTGMLCLSAFFLLLSEEKYGHFV